MKKYLAETFDDMTSFRGWRGFFGNIVAFMAIGLVLTFFFPSIARADTSQLTEWYFLLDDKVGDKMINTPYSVCTGCGISSFSDDALDEQNPLIKGVFSTSTDAFTVQEMVDEGWYMYVFSASEHASARVGWDVQVVAGNSTGALSTGNFSYIAELGTSNAFIGYLTPSQIGSTFTSATTSPINFFSTGGSSACPNFCYKAIGIVFSQTDYTAEIESVTTYAQAYNAINGIISFQNPVCTESGSCLVEVYPAHQELVSSTTPATFDVGFRVYIAEEDFEEGMYVKQEYRRNADQMQNVLLYSQTGEAPNTYDLEWEVPSAGEYLVLSTTSVSATGTYLMSTSIVPPSSFLGGIGQAIGGAFGFDFGASGALLRWNTTFLVGTTTYWDQVLLEDVNYFFTGGEEPTDPIIDCDLDLLGEGFNLMRCLTSLLIPPTSYLENIWDEFVDGAMSTVPLGYLTRFITIIMNPVASAPPPLEYTFGTASPDVLQGKEMSFQIFDDFGFLNSIVADDGSEKNIWDIVMPFFDAVIALGVLGVILYDLASIGVPTVAQYGRSRIEEMSERRSEDRMVKNLKIDEVTDEEYRNMRRNKLL